MQVLRHDEDKGEENALEWPSIINNQFAPASVLGLHR